jgi:phage-related protein
VANNLPNIRRCDINLRDFVKKTNKTPKSINDVCKQRIKRYETDVKKGKKEK